MAPFSFGGGQPPRPRPANTGRGGDVKRKGAVKCVLEVSVCFFDDDSGREIFLPLSKILDWWFTTCGTKRQLRLADLEPDDEITVVIPAWLARKEHLM